MSSEIKTGVFAEFAEKYHEAGMNVIPVNGKQPMPGLKWQHWQTVRQTEEDIEKLIQRFGHAPGIGVIMGKVSGLVAFDFDYKWCDRVQKFGIEADSFNKDYDLVQKLVDEVIKPYTVRKVGVAGFTAFFKWQEGMKPVTCDRNGTRLFDFKTNGQVVVPPSWHSNDKNQEPIYYRYTLGDLVHDINDLTELDFGSVLDLKVHLSITKDVPKGPLTRHDRLYRASMDWFRLGASKDEVAERLVQLDRKLHLSDKKGLYLTSDHCIDRVDALKSAKHWCERIWTHFLTKVGATEIAEKKMMPDEDGWAFLIEKPFADIRRCIVTKSVKGRIFKDDEWMPLIDLKSEVEILSRKLQAPVGQVREQMESYINRHRGKDFFCDIPDWDGVERVREYCKFVRCRDFNDQEFYLIFQRWCRLMFSRAYDSRVQNECIIFTGAQGIGKDFWVDDLFIESFVPYFGSLTIGKNTEDLYESVSRLLVAKISEFERLDAVSIEELKNIITTSSANMRRKYASEAKNHRMAASFIASSNNPDKVLRDTENRRFVIVDVEKIEHHPQLSLHESQMMVAEMLSWHQKNLDVKLPLELKEKINTKLGLLAPPDYKNEIADLLATRIAEVIEDRKRRFKEVPDFITVHDPIVVEVILDLERIYKWKGIGERTIRSIAKERFRGYKKKISPTQSAWGYDVKTILENRCEALNWEVH